jgi:hypothetical protein
MVMRAKIAVLTCGLDEIVDILNGIFTLFLRADLNQRLAGSLILDIVAVAGIVVDDCDVMRILGKQIDVNLGQIGIMLALRLTDICLITGQHEEILIGQVSMIAGGLVVGDAEDGVAVVLVGILQLGGRQLTVGDGAVAMQVCLVLRLIFFDILNHNMPRFVQKIDVFIVAQMGKDCKYKNASLHAIRKIKKEISV